MSPALNPLSTPKLCEKLQKSLKSLNLLESRDIKNLGMELKLLLEEKNILEFLPIFFDFINRAWEPHIFVEIRLIAAYLVAGLLEKNISTADHMREKKTFK